MTRSQFENLKGNELFQPLEITDRVLKLFMADYNEGIIGLYSHGSSGIVRYYRYENVYVVKKVAKYQRVDEFDNLIGGLILK